MEITAFMFAEEPSSILPVCKSLSRNAGSAEPESIPFPVLTALQQVKQKAPSTLTS